MDLAENIYFSLIGVFAAVLILLMLLIFRRTKKIGIVLFAVIIFGYGGYYVYFQTHKESQHENRYEQIDLYLKEQYLDRTFTIRLNHYEKGQVVGEFYVNDIETPEIGVTLYIDKEGIITQTSWWSKDENLTQQEIWRTIKLQHIDAYTLDSEIPTITKEDEWINDEITAFALTINDLPAIALFNYSQTDYGLIAFKESAQEGLITIEEKDYIFIYADEQYPEKTVKFDLENGTEFSLNIEQHKGRLIVEERP